MSNIGTLGLIRIQITGNKLIYTRRLLKLSEVVSYIGGLMGFLISFLFIMKNYTSLALDMNLSADLFY